MSVLTMQGPAFLGFYSVLCVVCLIGVRVLFSASESRLNGGMHLRDPYLIACLRGGARQLIQVATLSLAVRKLLEISFDGTKITAQAVPGAVQEPVEQLVLSCTRNQASPAQLLADPGLAAVAAGYQRRLAEMGLMVDGPTRERRRTIKTAVCAGLILLSVLKIAVALANGHTNVAFLIILTVVAVVVISKQGTTERTSSGNQVLKNLRTLFNPLKRQPRPGVVNAAPEAALLAAVFGTYMMPGLDDTAWQKMFPPPARTGGDGGGSGCSSSGGCGGGGGGGCGGCGGGD